MTIMSRHLENIKDSSLSAVLNIGATEKCISIKEHKNADSNFVITNLMKQIFSDKLNKVCLVITHNTLGHYQNIGKKVGFDLLKQIQDENCVSIELLKSVTENIADNKNYFELKKEDVVKELYLDIKSKVDKLSVANGGRVYLIIDDISHLLDLGVDKTDVIIFLNYCSNILSNNLISVVINCHVSTQSDSVISSAVDYMADVNIKVYPLYTGSSQDVNGFISIKRKNVKKEMLLHESVFHYKANDKEIKVFAPGQSVNYLYK